MADHDEAGFAYEMGGSNHFRGVDRSRTDQALGRAYWKGYQAAREAFEADARGREGNSDAAGRMLGKAIEYGYGAEEL